MKENKKEMKKNKRELIAEIIELQRRLNRVLRHCAPEALMELNLTIPQLKSLFFISREGRTSPKRLAAAFGVTPSNVTGIVERLVEQKLVSRQESPKDRRVLLLEVTEKGETLLANLREKRITQVSEILAQMSAEELTIVAQGLCLLVKAAEGRKDESNQHQGIN